MLLSLHIKNYALIEELSVEFTAGLNILTGETGAGKSIIIESLGFILGERITAKAVRNGADKCSITAHFDASKAGGLREALNEKGITAEAGEPLIIRREVDLNSRSRAFINDMPAAAESLRDAGALLVDICGQSDQQLLSKRDEQRKLLDSFAQNDALLEKNAANFSDYRELLKKKSAATLSDEEKLRLIDLYSFQKKEIIDSKIFHGEDEEIEKCLPELKNSDKFSDYTSQIHELLYAGDGSALAKLEQSRRLLESILALGGNLTGAHESLLNGIAILKDASSEVDAYAKRLNIDPDRLNELLERKDAISKLKKKYGTSIDDILLYMEKVSSQLDSLQKADVEKEDLQRKISAAYSELKKSCLALTSSRKKASLKLSECIKKELSELGMKKARFDISILPIDEPAAFGSDNIEFLFSANPGQSAGPLKDIASGGELSRVMLAIKSAFAKADRIPLMIFDEIDAGVGGPMGQVVGKKLKNLSENHQIIAITHLPQIAAFSDSHLYVSKDTIKSKSFTRIKNLSAEEKVSEVARMLSGENITDSAKHHALELIKSSS